MLYISIVIGGIAFLLAIIYITSRRRTLSQGLASRSWPVIRVKWLDPARRSLVKRDSLMRKAITVEFENAPLALATKIGERNRHPYFITPVAGNRYTVVWDFEGGVANVHSVVPVCFAKSDLDTLRREVSEVVKLETGVNLEICDLPD